MSFLHQSAAKMKQPPHEQGKTNQQAKGIEVGHGFLYRQQYFTPALIKLAARKARNASRINQGLEKTMHIYAVNEE